MTKIGSTLIARLDGNALDDIPLAVVRISTAQRITYLNRAARVLLNGQVDIGTSIAEVSMEEESRRKLAAELGDRFVRRLGSSYELSLRERGSSIRKLIEVTAVPEYDSDGTLAGSMGFVRDRSVDATNTSLHRAIEGAATWNELLETVTAELHKVISFDSFLVVLVSEKGNHLRRLFEAPPDPAAISPIRWWPMLQVVRDVIMVLETSAVSVAEMFSKEPYKSLGRTDLATQKWLERGFKHLLRMPIYHNKKLVAIVVLQKKVDVPFTDDEERIFDELPVPEAIAMALTLDKKGEMQFWLDLIQELGERADEAGALRQHFVTRLKENYGWEHVALFRLDEDHRRFRMQCQSPAELARDYSQSFDKGWLSEVRRSRKAVVVGNLKADPSRYVPGIPDAVSEMCVPIPGERLRWILNVESRLRDAFAEEELQSVQFLLSVVGFMLDRAAMVELQASIFASVADGIILTSSEGTIENINPAGLRMLGVSLEALRGRNFADLLFAPNGVRDDDFAKDIIAAPKVPSTAVSFVSGNGAKVSALISGAALSPEIGGKVYVASDLTHVRRSERIDELKQIFNKVAAEMRVPLSLACSFLSDARSRDNIADLAERALAQLRRADLPLERIVRLADKQDDDAIPVGPVDVSNIILSIKSELPESQSGNIEPDLPEEHVLVKAGFPELTFCVRSIIAFMLRQKSQADRVLARVERVEGRGHIDFSIVGREASTGESAISQLEETVREFAFPEGVIENFIQRMGGQYDGRGSGHLHYHLSLNLADATHEDLATAGA